MSAGGGELLAAGPKLRDDMRLLSVAIAKRWPVPMAMKSAIVERLEQIVNDTDPELALAAIDVARKLEAQNQLDDHHAETNGGGDRLSAIAAKLGISVASITDAEGNSSGNPAGDGPAGNEIGTDDRR